MSSRYDQRCWEDVKEGEQLTRIEDHLDFRRVAMSSATTWDWYPGHHDPSYAQELGLPAIFVNTMHTMGFIDRLVTNWAGPLTFVVRRKVRLGQPLYAGDSMVGEGLVTRRWGEEEEGRPHHFVDIEASVTNQSGGSCASAAVTVALPSRALGQQGGSGLWYLSL
jgi:acyl dehydratase